MYCPSVIGHEKGRMPLKGCGRMDRHFLPITEASVFPTLASTRSGSKGVVSGPTAGHPQRRPTANLPGPLARVNWLVNLVAFVGNSSLVYP